MVYPPQTNNIVEIFHHQLKAALKAQPSPHLWMDALPLVPRHSNVALGGSVCDCRRDDVWQTL